MQLQDTLNIALAIITSIGGGALIIAASANWLAKIWASRMLENERSVHAQHLEAIRSELEKIKQKDITRHNDKINTYKDAISLFSDLLFEIESITMGKSTIITDRMLESFSKTRFKIYGNISLVSNQKVMNDYNQLIEFFIPIIYDGKTGSWEDMRHRADNLLNSMREDLGVEGDEIRYTENHS